MGPLFFFSAFHVFLSSILLAEVVALFEGFTDSLHCFSLLLAEVVLSMGILLRSCPFFFLYVSTSSLLAPDTSCRLDVISFDELFCFCSEYFAFLLYPNCFASSAMQISKLYVIAVV